MLVYGGNSLDGAYSLFTIYTGAHDYETTRGWGVLMQEGALCRDGSPWGFYAPWDSDDRAAWDAWVDRLNETDSDHYQTFTLAGTYADDRVGPLAGSFVGWFDATYGLDALKMVCVADATEAGLKAATGLDMDGLEAAWLAAVEARIGALASTVTPGHSPWPFRPAGAGTGRQRTPPRPPRVPGGRTQHDDNAAST